MANAFEALKEPKSVGTKSVAIPATEIVNMELLVDFNRVVQESLNKVKDRLDQLNGIIRCDNLPHVHARLHDMKQLSDILVRLILHHPPKSGKLFIYVKSNQLKKEVEPATESSRLHFYEICFHTNSCNEALWQDAHKQDLNECNYICARYSGTFTSALGNADCLLKLTLPGKLF
jgi:hypothetical protein